MPPRKTVDVDLLKRLFAETGSTKKVGEALGLSQLLVYRRLREAGIEVHKRTVAGRAEKQCHICHAWLPASAFNKCRSRGDGLSATCRTCWAAYQRERALRVKFGMTSEEYAAILAKQGGGCAICNHALGPLHKDKRHRLPIDHCHATGKVRGILCSPCNTGLGQFKDDPGLLEKAAAYVREQGVL